MVKTISKVFKRLMVLVTLGAFVPYLATILIPYIDTGKYWYISILGLGFPILFGVLMCLLIFWVLMRSPLWIVLCLVVISTDYRQITRAFGFNINHSFVLEKKTDHIRVMQWNVHNWNQEWEAGFDSNAYPEMMKLIEKYNADILFIQEFYETIDKKRYPSNLAQLKNMGYEYCYFLHPGLVRDNSYAGVAIFSKNPIVAGGKVKVSKKENTDPLAYADIKIGNRYIRAMTVHLQSVEFKEEQYDHINEIRKRKRPGKQESLTIISKLKKGFGRRKEQAFIVNEQVEKSPHPVILCGDFNDVPNSGVYFTITQNLQDAFLKKDFFIGRTFRFISPTLRIDYILPEKNKFKVEQFKRIRKAYSDHYPIVADLSWVDE